MSIDGVSKEAAQGEEIAYKVMLANLGGEDKLLSLEVAGEKLWANSRVDPGFITLKKDTTGEFYVYLKADEKAAVGKHIFAVKLKSGDTVIAEKALTTEVTAGSETQSNTIVTKKALIIGFGVLVVLLVIVGLIIAFNRMNDEETGEVPTNEEGQAYY